ncbi:hypothetical protein CRM22_002216 [Opisthorchis felineus]|uniref:Inositol-tetrakisphosphate 1-kinase n=1 Tax=Opisthorchis felineus TaxID=147828 RepID=A0A4V3SGG2_OPIFE|nr:hypothetical protein CRM22_002216 [Opisthorchis felineus]
MFTCCPEIDLTNDSTPAVKLDAVLHNMSDFLSGKKGLRLIDRAETFYEHLLANTNVVCIDPIVSVRRIFSRLDQLELAKMSLESSNFADRAFVPEFCLLESNDRWANVHRLKEYGLRFPIICKPIRAQGDGAHDMAVVFDENGLEEIHYPVVAQRFINHNAQLFKISVVEEHVFTTQRPSIKNMHTSHGQRTLFFHTFLVSKDGHQYPLTKLDPNDKLGSIVPEEDEVLFAKIATKVRQDFCLDLFSVDVIECVEQGANSKNAEDMCEGYKRRKFAVIDVNPLPSYKNVPHFHHHLGNLIRKKLSLPTIPLEDTD